MANKEIETDVPPAAANVGQLGEFPFPLTAGAKESQFLTWLRNHSNYWTPRGFIDYLRSIGVLIRGIVVNFLIFLPYLLIVAIGLGYAHHWMLANPFYLTLGVVGFGTAWVLLFPVLIPLFKVFSYRRSLETGSESSVKQRSLYERSFGSLLLAIFVTASLESMPWALEWLHDRFHQNNLGWREGLASVAAAVVLLSGSDKLLKVLSGVKKKIAMLLIGLVGLLVPLLVVFFATHYLIYGLPPSEFVMYSPLVVPILGAVGILVAVPMGISREAFSPNERLGVVGLFFVITATVLVVIIMSREGAKESAKSTKDLYEIIQPLERVTSQFAKISNKKELTPKVAALVDKAVLLDGEHNRIKREVETFVETANRSRSSARSDEMFAIRWWHALSETWAWKSMEANAIGTVFTSGLNFITLGDEFSILSPGSLVPLRMEFKRLAHLEILATLQARLLEDGDTRDPARYMRELLVEQSLIKNVQVSVQEALRESVLRTANTSNIEAEKTNEKPDYTKRLNELAGAYLKTLDPAKVVQEATLAAKTNLQRLANQPDSNVSVEQFAKLLSEKELFELVEKKYRDVPGTAKLARLSGTVELAKLVSKQEVADHVFDMAEASASISLKRTTELIRSTTLKQVDVNLLRKPDDDIDKMPVRVRVITLANLLDKIETTNTPNTEAIEILVSISKQSSDVVENWIDRLKVFWSDKESVPQNKVPDDRRGNALKRTPADPSANNQSRIGDLLTDDEIAKAAGEQLAQLALADFTVNQLAIVAFQPEIVYWSYENNKRFQGITKQDFDAYVNEAKVRRNLHIRALADFAFPERGISSKSPQSVEPFVKDVSLPDINKFCLARLALSNNDGKLRQMARANLVAKALQQDGIDPTSQKRATLELSELHRISGFESLPFAPSEFADLAIKEIDGTTDFDLLDNLITTLMFGKFGRLDRVELSTVKGSLTRAIIGPKTIFIALLAGVLWLAGWLTIDVNLTSIHGLYRDRLASAFLIGQDHQGNIDVEEDVDLEDICRYVGRSIAPYHLVNVAINLQGSKDLSLRDRNSDFFIFSKRFIGGDRTGYCRSETLEQVFPQMSLATAMAISAAAASPNMGRATSPLLVAFMTLLNIRMGYWMPNPGLLEETQDKSRWKKQRKKSLSASLGYRFQEVFARELIDLERRWCQVDPQGLHRRCIDQSKPSTPSIEHGLIGMGLSGGGIRSAAINLGITQALHKRGVFDHVDYLSTVSGGGYLGASISTLMRTRTKLFSEFAGTVSVEVEAKRLYSEFAGTVKVERISDDKPESMILTPSEHNRRPKKYRISEGSRLVVEDGAEVTEGVLLISDSSSTPDSKKTAKELKGKQYLQITGDQIVVVTPSEFGTLPKEYRFSKDAALDVQDKENISAGKLLLKRRSRRSDSEIEGTVSVETKENVQIVSVQGANRDEPLKYQFSRFDKLCVQTGDTVKKGQPLIQRHNTIGQRFGWRVRTTAFLREMISRLDEKHWWVNLSDGGHIENLAGIELLRRRCKFIVIGDGEADPNLHFNGLATLIRYARIDLGIKIDINLNAIRLQQDKDDADYGNVSREHWAVGTITYPEKDANGKHELGKLLYLKSSFTGDEDEVMQEYRHRHSDFPHQSTADQFFDEGQFEAYRSLGQHIAEQALKLAPDNAKHPGHVAFADLEEWFEGLEEYYKKKYPVE